MESPTSSNSLWIQTLETLKFFLPPIPPYLDSVLLFLLIVFLIISDQLGSEALQVASDIVTCQLA